MDEVERLTRRVRVLLVLFVLGLIVSGVTAVPLPWEARLLYRLFGPETAFGHTWPNVADWVARVHTALKAVQQHYPFLFYGTDWLAFAHFVIAVAFWGPLRDPVRNVWVVEFGLIACVLVIPMALIVGTARGIPLFWRLIDCSFGVGGFLVLWPAWQDIRRLSRLLLSYQNGAEVLHSKG